MKNLQTWKKSAQDSIYEFQLRRALQVLEIIQVLKGLLSVLCVAHRVVCWVSVIHAWKL